jgi:hypothetical protein
MTDKKHYVTIANCVRSAWYTIGLAQLGLAGVLLVIAHEMAE